MQLSSAPADVLASIEDFLLVSDLLQLSAASRHWHVYYSDSWRRLHWQRWGRSYAAKWGIDEREVSKATVSSSILRDLVLDKFWLTIEAAFLGLQSLPGDRPGTGHVAATDESTAASAQQQQPQQQPHQHHEHSTPLWKRLFALLQPQRAFQQAKPLFQLSDAFTSTTYNWKLACCVSERGARMRTCRICEQLDVLTPQRISLETQAFFSLPSMCPGWIAPCRCPGLVHRHCMENSVENAAVGKAWVSLDDTNALRAFTERYNQANMGQCGKCKYNYVRGYRLPETTWELICIGVNDKFVWRRTRNCLVNWMALVCFVCLCEAWSVGSTSLTWPRPGGFILAWWLLQQIVLLDIFFSPRFSFVISRVWGGPFFTFYCRLYMYFVCACGILLVLNTPLGCRHLFPSMDCEALPIWWTALGVLNAFVYAIVGNIVLATFWKTNYWVVSVGSVVQRPLNTHPFVPW